MKQIKNIGIPILLLVMAMIILQGCGLKKEEYIEVTVSDSVFDDKYYYEQLNEKKRTAYREIYQGFSECKKEFEIHCQIGTEENDILYAVLYDSPELFWCDGEVVSTEYASDFVTVRPEYNCSVREKEKKEAEIKKVVEEILEQAPNTDDEYEKVKYIYEYLVDHVAYVEDVSDNQNIYSSLVGGESVCAGYAKATQYLLQLMGVYCIYVTGEATSQLGTMPHAWNIVRCDDVYYYVDTTWADPLFGGEQDTNLDMPMVYEYLCCTSATLNSKDSMWVSAS